MEKNLKKAFIKDYLETSKTKLEFIKIAFSKKKHGIVIRECQSITELLGKSLLIKCGFIVPKVHNLKDDIEDLRGLFSKKFDENIAKFKKLSKNLALERERALYGEEELGKTPEDIFSKEDAQHYYKQTKEFYELISEELKPFLEER